MENRKLILDRIRQGRCISLKKVYFTVPDGSVPATAEYLQIPRLLILISGSKYARLPLPNGAADVHLQTGDVLYCLPNTWEMHDWRGHYEMLCIVPRQDYLRVSLYQRDSAEDASRPEASFHHTGLPYSEAMRNTVNALNTSVATEDATIVHHLSKALLGMAEHECRRTQQDAKGRPVLLFNRIRNWVSHSFQEDIDREVAAKVFSISPGYVSQLFKAHNQSTFQDYLAECRMVHARKLLEQTDLPVYQVADLCGFGNYVHFVRRFRQLNATSPAKYRESAVR